MLTRDTATLDFQDPGLFARLDHASLAEWDAAPFGIIGFDADGTVDVYNAFEAAAAGLSPGRVLGTHMFDDLAPCMNNWLVAQRFEDEAEIDDTIPYVLTLRMRPTGVRLRLLQHPDRLRSYVLVEWQAAGRAR